MYFGPHYIQNCKRINHLFAFFTKKEIELIIFPCEHKLSFIGSLECIGKYSFVDIQVPTYVSQGVFFAYRVCPDVPIKEEGEV